MEHIVNNVKGILNVEEVKVVQRLMGGMSNYTYVIEADGQFYTYRIPGEYSENFVDRNIEIQNLKVIDLLKISNQTVYLNTDNGIKIAKYIEGTPLSQIDSSDYPYEKVAEILKQIHNSNLKAVNDYQPFTRLETYEYIIKFLGYVHPQTYQELKEIFYKYYKNYLESQPLVLTHGDSQPSNFVIGENQILVVDFEFCGNNDLIYDISCFANKKYEDGLKLLNAYFKNPSYDELLRFHLWRAFQCFQWYNVAVFKELKGLSITLCIDFNKVSENYLNLISFYLKKALEIEKNK